MANEVYANNMEISCKAADGKSVACFPDVCFTPPVAPPTPMGVPIPYPNTGMSKDTTRGTRTVKITRKEVMLKDKSYFKTSYGDEAGNAPKKGVITSKIKGKVYFTSWSMNVKFEGQNVVRHLDMTTHNHASQPGNTPPWPHLSKMSPSTQGKCKREKKRERKSCQEYKPYGEKNVCKEAELSGEMVNESAWASKTATRAKANKCLSARRCQLVPYRPKDEAGIAGCCPAQTPDHVIPKSSFSVGAFSNNKRQPGWEEYSKDTAPCMCVEGWGNTHGSHGVRHSEHKALGVIAGVKKGDMREFSKEASMAAQSTRGAFPESNCSERCLTAQLADGHKKMLPPNTQPPKVKHSPSGRSKPAVLNRTARRPSP
ncbi:MULTISPECIES: PAAR-like domain-containing protein [Pseudomonas]|jgi:hypothetical protein|uniref:PAAR-like domain-containing protein n=1 Tax=Pseudomonas TaxID=286 RepID=UPI001A9336EF|nr:PAAR-like domain-containing protein [Pseudomonas sp. GW456-L15]